MQNEQTETRLVEQEILATIFANDEWRGLLFRELSEDDFQSPFHRAIFTECKQNGTAPDAAAVFLSLPDFIKKTIADPIKRFTDIVEGPTVMDPAHAIAELKSERRRQRALELGNAISKCAERGELAKVEDYARELVASESPQERKSDPPFPYQAMTGAAGEFTLAHSGLVESPEAFLFMGFLTCLGSVMSKRLTVNSYIRIQPRLNVVLLGQSAFDRKSTSLNIVTRFFNETLEDGFPVSWGVGSAEGLQLSLQQHQQSPCGLLLAVDELKSLVSKCSIEGSVLLPCINTLFESNQAHNATKKKVISITDAHLSILAASTLPTYERLFNSTFTDIGFTNRLFIVVGKSTNRYAIPRRLPDADRRELADYLGQVLKHVGEGLVLDFAPEASAFYEKWYARMEKTEHARRLDTYSMRLAMLLAVNDLKPVIDLETIQHATALCDWQLEIRRIHDPIDADSKMAQMEERIRRTLRQHGPLRERELKRYVSANRAGLWFYAKAADNLRNCGEIEYNAKRREYRLA